MAVPAELDLTIGRALDEVFARDEPVPAAVREYARAVFGVRAIDAELAVLTFDSSVNQLVRARVEAERVTTFAAEGLSIELREDIGSNEVLGRLDPATPGTFLVQRSQDCAGGDIAVAGTFRFERPVSPFTLRIVLGDRVVDTDPVVW